LYGKINNYTSPLPRELVYTAGNYRVWNRTFGSNFLFVDPPRRSTDPHWDNEELSTHVARGPGGAIEGRASAVKRETTVTGLGACC
jgi:hypothetical protein